MATTALSLYSLKERRTYPIKLPASAFFSDMRWSPDGIAARLRRAFADGVAGVGGRREDGRGAGRERRAGDGDARGAAGRRRRSAGNGGGRLLQWLPDGSLLTVMVPPNRGPEPQEPAVPMAPIIRRSRDRETPTATQPFLLRTPNDERLFKYYTTAQLVTIAPGRAPRPIGAPLMYLDYWVSPDGKSILRESLEEPFSYLTGFNAFGRRLEVIDLDGKVLAEIRRRPLQEAQTRGNDPAADNAPRDVAWRPDGKGLSMLLARTCRRRRSSRARIA